MATFNAILKAGYSIPGTVTDNGYGVVASFQGAEWFMCHDEFSHMIGDIYHTAGDNELAPFAMDDLMYGVALPVMLDDKYADTIRDTATYNSLQVQ